MWKAPDSLVDVELEVQYKHPPSLAWAEAYVQAAADYVPSLVVNGEFIDTDSWSDNDPDSPSGVTYDYPFATDIVRAAVVLLAQEAKLVPDGN